ncbi:CHAP domain-containing protein [Spongiactinospora sp. TRM90649]|uniref:CHAP domain-containing protein n=1 Tax=Spongiactinospora sp. TRM90649 TaxID=3031114 RepID=UPI0023F6F0C9|nr:CHAP domain-containing protein [Spongiactinospora sp. TRM90649]MDF5752195.1 CHAP domain-containing protein [Spongiactinospora sp. TRM90649]
MDPITEDLLKAVRAELGYREKSGQHTKFGRWYAAKVGDPQYRNAPWCDMYIAWAADRAGIADYVGSFAWTPSHAVWFKQQGAWTDRPEPGALVFYDWGGSKNYKKIDHVGVVERVADGKIHTIEANVDGVWLRRKVRDESKVVGYGVPRMVKEARLAAEQPTAEPTLAFREVEGIGRDGLVLGYPLPPEGLVLLIALATTASGLALANVRRRPRRRAAPAEPYGPGEPADHEFREQPVPVPTRRGAVFADRSASVAGRLRPPIAEHPPAEPVPGGRDRGPTVPSG